MHRCFPAFFTGDASPAGDGRVRGTHGVWNTDTRGAYNAGQATHEALVIHRFHTSGAGVMMMDCGTFLDGYSDFRDGLLPLAERVAFEAHVRECDHCARYHRVVDKGARIYRDLPRVEVSEDFMDRLQHRLYHVDDELANARRRRGPVSRGAVAALAAAASIAAVALLPRLYPLAAPTVTMLPPVAARAPQPQPAAYHLADAGEASTGLAAQLEEVGVEVYPMPYSDVLYRSASYGGGAVYHTPAAE
jgi:Putative zinc-finger